jgi:hypothetical protein
MNARITRLALAGSALLCLAAPASFAANEIPASAFALPAIALDAPSNTQFSGMLPEVAALHVSEVPDVSVAGVIYRPKGTGTTTSASPHPPTSSKVTNVTQIYGGRMDPDGPTDGEFLMGIRTGPKLSRHLQLGVMFDWVRDSDYGSSFTTSAPGPGGVDITTRYDYEGAYTDLFPLMGFVQLSLNEKRFLSPYGGIGGGYQWLNVTAYDRYGTWYDATFGGWGWQAWAGAGLRVTDGVRLTGEAMYNAVQLSRNVYDPVNGWTNHETVPMYGVGARFGLAFGF